MRTAWKGYQPSVPDSKYTVRTQSADPVIASAALRRLQMYMQRGPRVQQRPNMSLAEKLMMRFMESQGQALAADEVVRQHQLEDE